MTWVGKTTLGHYICLCFSNRDVNFIKFSMIPLCQNIIHQSYHRQQCPHIWVFNSLPFFLSSKSGRSRHTLKPMLFNADSVATGVNWRPVSVWMSRSAKICTMSWMVTLKDAGMCIKYAKIIPCLQDQKNTYTYTYIYILYSWKTTYIYMYLYIFIEIDYD